MNLTRTLATAAVLAFVGTGAFAQTPAAKPAAPAATSTMKPAAMGTKKVAKPRTATSLACSKEADAKKLHGKARKHFMSTCKKAGPKT